MSASTGNAVHRAIVALGSNIEPRREYLSAALRELSAMPETAFLKAGAVIETEPVDVPPEFRHLKFLNQVAVFDSRLEPMEFSARMHAIEDRLGRVRTVRNGPRTIDLDLIEYGGVTMDTPELTLPHPRARSRDFIVRQMRELGLWV